jgi:hypothetical protein
MDFFPYGPTGPYDPQRRRDDRADYEGGSISTTVITIAALAAMIGAAAYLMT